MDSNAPNNEVMVWTNWLVLVQMIGGLLMDKHLTPHQKGIIKRYYENKDDIANQKLSELVSDLWLARLDRGKQEKLWKQVRTALVNAGVKAEDVDGIMKRKNLEELAEIVNEMF